MAEAVELRWIDLLAPAWFLLCWLGYVLYADGRERRTLMRRMHEYRLVWMRRMLERDNRIVDTQITMLLVQNISFFASASILLIGGLVAILGAREQAMALLAEVPFAAAGPAVLWEAKVALLILIFVYAFFKFTWALRQFNYVAIIIGACPPPSEAGGALARSLASRAATIAGRAADHFNKAMRAYYFGFAALAWFLSPWLLLAASALVVLVNWRREFTSQSMAVLGPLGEALE
jgi:uncharacterized membrane protein